MDDDSLLKAFKLKDPNKNEQKQINQAYNFIHARLERYALSLTKQNQSDADELILITITALWNTCQNNTDFKPKNLMKYVHAILRNKWIDHLKQLRGITSTDPTALTDTTDLTALNDLINQLLITFNIFETIPDINAFFLQEVKNLTPECQNLFTLKLQETLNYSEIASIYHITENTARQRFHVCKQAFIQIILKHPKLAALQETLFTT